MSERGPSQRDLETPKQRFTAELKRSMMVLNWELGKSDNFISALRISQLSGKQREGEEHESIFFDEPAEEDYTESYEYSDNLRPRKGAEPLEAITLKRQDCTLFLQYAHFHGGKKKAASIAELTIGDKQYKGKEALARIHEAFPRFFPAPKAPAAQQAA